MPIFFLVESPRSELVRCAHCFVVKPRAYKTSNNYVYCDDCSQLSPAPKIQEHEYELYKICQNYNERDYVNHASEVLGMPHTTIEGRIQRLRKKGIPINGFQKRFPYNVVNSSGEVIPLTKLRYQVLTLATSKENLIKYEIVKAIASQVGISKEAIRNHLQHLRKDGFTIPHYNERVKNLKLDILRSLDFEKDRSQQIKKLAKKHKRSRESISLIVREIEKEKGCKIKEIRASDEIMAIFTASQKPMSANEIKDKLQYKSRHTVYVTCMRLADKGKLGRCDGKFFLIS